MKFNTSEVIKILEWIEKVIDYFKPYKPEVKSMTINHRTKNSEINLLLHIPDNLKRRIRLVEVPAYQNFTIYDMMDESFSRIGSLWSFEDGKWKLDASNLPPSEKYLLIMRGQVPEQTLANLVRIQPATNRDQTEELDRYWLNSILRNAELLERIWHQLNVEEVNVGVRVGIERYFSTAIPKELSEKLKVTRKWIQVGHGRNREEIFRTWRELRRVSRTSKITAEDVINTIYKLTTGETFTRFLSIDRPYTIGDVRRDEAFMGLFPEKMLVDALTELSLKQPTATGYLSFKKKDYSKNIEDFFRELV